MKESYHYRQDNTTMFFTFIFSALCMSSTVVALIPTASFKTSPHLTHLRVLAAQPLITDGPLVDEHILLGRQVLETCG